VGLVNPKSDEKSTATFDQNRGNLETLFAVPGDSLLLTDNAQHISNNETVSLLPQHLYHISYIVGKPYAYIQCNSRWVCIQ
jgi:hypothetical protein